MSRDWELRCTKTLPLFSVIAVGAVLVVGCGGSAETAGSGNGGSGTSAGRSSGGRPGGGPPWGAGAAASQPAVPVEVAEVARRDLSSFIETNGVLEAEREVDLVARATGPITELVAEENQRVAKGQLLARLDQDQARATLDISRVAHEEARLAFDRIEALQQAQLVSREEHEQAKARLDSARAREQSDEIQLAYTEVRAPFDGLIVRRYVKFAESVAANQPLFRLSDFTPLHCPIQVPERSLTLLRPGQQAFVTVEGFPNERFAAKVLRISPVVEADTGTVRVTLEVDVAGKLRPGMFASVFLETDQRQDVLVVPKAALSLDSVGDTVFVVNGEVAERREIRIGVREGEYVEVLEGLEPGDRVVRVGQEGLADGTPIQILGALGASASELARSNGPTVTGSGATARTGEPSADRSAGGGSSGAGSPGTDPHGNRPRGGFDPSDLTDEQLERVKARMKSRGLTDEQIKERLEEMKKSSDSGHQ